MKSTVSFVMIFAGVILMQGTYNALPKPSAGSDATISVGSTYENKSRGFHIRVPAGWDFEDLGNPTKNRWDFLVKSPLGQTNSGGIHVTALTGKSDVQQVSKETLAAVSNGRPFKTTTEESLMLGKASARKFTIVCDGAGNKSCDAIYVIGQESACWTLHCFMENSEDAGLGTALDTIVKGLRLDDLDKRK